jgi:DNA-directed RNA polymerase subunit RPC12/RpoP
MLQPAGVSARPAFFKTVPLNRTFRSPGPRPAPIKPPERCPHCNSSRLIKKGARQKKLECVPLYRCRACGRTFTPGPRAVRNKTYPVNEILEALTLYDRGNTLEETARNISSRHGHPVAASTISRWLSEHPALTTYRRLRARGRRLFTPPQVIRSHKLYHRQVYEFAIHRAKLAFLRDGSLDEKRAATAASTARFAALANFLESVPTACPHDLFRREDGARGSQLGSALINESARLIVIERQNTATETASLILPSVGTNYERHPKLQRFMLANDSTTVAVEVPIWLYAQDIAAIERRWSIELLPKAATAPSDGEARSITGHIDFLQIRNGAIHILDYKPDASTGKPFAQLTLYALALALSHLTGIPLFDFKCAWFNERQYCEFFPRTVLARKNAR